MFNQCFTCNSVKHINKNSIMKTLVKIWTGVIYKDVVMDIDFVNYTKSKYGCFRDSFNIIILNENDVKKAQKEYKPTLKT